MLYPLQLEPIFKQRIWGGYALADLFGSEFYQAKPVGEVWAVADYPPDTSKVRNGFLAGTSLSQIVGEYPLELTGSTEYRRFPWLIKFLDASDRLSVQVHPNDQMASLYRGEHGKAEMWYILKAGPNAEIIYGLKPGVDKQQFFQAVEQERVASCLNRVKVKDGDVFYIPPGMVHALGRDLVVAEIQQNSDTTYRIFDYHRVDESGKPRKLHVAKALEAIDYSLHPSKSCFCTPLESRHFRVDLLNTGGTNPMPLPDKQLQALLILRGEGGILHNSEVLTVRAGNAVVVPAQLTGVQLLGKLQVLRSRLGAKVNTRRNNRREPRSNSQAL